MLDIYRASAGSGKTFALTLEYFRIIFETPAEYKNILAVTFTNKATEEMKSRIINELYKLSTGEKSDYRTILQQEFQFTDEQLKNKAGLLISMLLHNYGRLAVTTIDRFFQRIVKSFTRELGIFPGYNVELDTDFVLQKAIDRVMQRVKTDDLLRNWISELMSSSVEDGKSWSVKAKIAELGEELFKENYMLFDKHILDKFGDRKFLKKYRTFLNQIIREFEKQLTDIGEQGMILVREGGLELSDFKGNKAGCAAYFRKLADRNFDPPTATVRKGIDNADAWCAKKSPVKSQIEALYPELNCLLNRAIQFFDTEYCRYISAGHLADNLYQLGILNDLYQEVRNYCDEKGLMLLSDTTHVLNKLIGGNDTSFLFEKAGNYYKHLMIDEFQDTSSMQWKNFKPLMTNSLSEGCRAMIVGDVKQSIYRWRNGDWGLLARGVEEEFRALGVRNVVLENNWRSGEEIVRFNNTFFDKASRVLRALYDLDAGENNPCSEAITDAYKDIQQNPRKINGGYVDILFGPEKKEEESDGKIMEEVVSVVNDILDRGGEQKDIVILVRSGKEGAFVANYFMEYNKTSERIIHFISNDSLYVWSSPYVQLILAILKYIIEPYDAVNRATILYFYNTFVCMRNGDADGIFKQVNKEDIDGIIDTGFISELDKIMSYSLFETVEMIIKRFALRGRSDEVPYFIAFQDIVYEYESNNSNSIALFLEWWSKEQSKRVLSTAESVNAVRILTIHKSKGLEFEHVIVPFCSWELDSIRPVRRIWCTNNEPGFCDLDYAPLNYSSRLAETIFKNDYFDEHLRAYVDNLNLLYVALTRAKSELYIRPYGPKYNKDGSVSLSDAGAFIWYVLSALKAGEEKMTIDEHMNLRQGNKKNHFAGREKENLDLMLTDYPVYELGERGSVKYRFRDYLEAETTGLTAVDEGKLLHEIFKSIQYTEDVDNAVRMAYLNGLISVIEYDKYCAKIMAYISNPQTSDWFSPHNQIINEKDILFPGGNKVRPDRIIISGDIVRIIDYKFGQSEENKYLKQVKFYCNTLQKMGYPNVEGYIWYVKLGKVVPV